MGRGWSGGLFLLILATGCSTPQITPIPEATERVWIGPDYFANRMLDWRIHDGRLECVEGRRAKPMRTLHLLTRALAEEPGTLEMSVRTGPIDPAGKAHEDTWTGFLIGVGGDHVDFRASALCHHWPGADGGLIAAVDGAGRVVFRDNAHLRGPRGPRGNIPLSAWPKITPAHSEQGMALTDDIELHLSIEGSTVSLSARDTATGELISRATIEDVDPQQLSGNVALVSHRSRRLTGPGYWFRDWRLSGTKVEVHPDRAFGPVFSALYTLSGDTLKMTAQMGPLGERDAQEASLQIERNGRWTTVAKGSLRKHSYTVPFRVENWDRDRETRYRIATLLRGKPHYYHGTIRREPSDRKPFVVGAFTGHHISAQGKGHWNGKHIWYPHNDLVAAVHRLNPDLLFFSGDQIYEGGLAGIVRNPPEKACIDYLYHWIRWCWAFQDLTRDRPTVCIPDDHDVYHGNIWGAGGRKAVKREGLRMISDSGGYIMDPLFVNAVHRTQTSHLPDPVDPAPIDQGISVYFTRLEYAGMSFAIIADRMWKSSPSVMVPKGRYVNGWSQAPGFDPAAEADVPGAVLLGDRQLKFLEQWANDWRGGARMKVLLSQTLFANVATLPKDARSDAVVPGMRQPSSRGEYMEGDKLVADADSNGWPQTGRNKALRAIRKGFAFHIAGDQHLGSFIQYGVDDWNDAAFALCVPSIANVWPRRWFPPEPGKNRTPNAPRYAGEFKDGFGNRITVHAVSNPGASGQEPAALYDRAPGYGIVRFDRRTREITTEVWQWWIDKMYPGWPIRVHQRDNYGRTPVAHLPTLKFRGMEEPVVQVVEEATGETIYTLRIQGRTFRPGVFAEGAYTLLVGEPGTPRMKRLTGVKTGGDEPIEVKFP